MSMIAHPMTLGDDNSPKYSARDFRNMVNTFLAPSDGTGPINTVVQGVKMTSDQPICTVSGRTATIKTHIGILNPYPSAGPYTYYSSDMPVTLPNTTESWKIAVIVDDPSEGHGSTPQVRLDTYPSSTPDSNIPGMVLALVHNGIADDIAPRIASDSTIYTQKLDQLQAISAVDGQTGVVRSTGRTYTSKGGSWVTPTGRIQRTIFKPQDAKSFQMSSTPYIDIDNDRRLLFINLASFHSTVRVANFPLYFYVSGPKPKQDIDLGTLGFVLTTGGPYVKYFRWRVADNNIIVTNDISVSDNVIMDRVVVPIPDNVEFQ